MKDLEEFERNIKVGDRTIFELNDLDNQGPRWQFNDDLGPTDKWSCGTVCYVDDKIIQIEYSIFGSPEIMTCTWPNHDHPDYEPLQWEQEGYLEFRESATNPQPRCECGAEVAGTSHVDWCPKYR